ncbi:MAG: HAMP domain-containing protein [Sediminimonas qiaohouensis]|uniref:histidine kinase n=1 Tax=Sediminimonas qiaohouensis TaxID=552061 RepID=A0A7C9LSQ6_9RHOB|nr:ATP-binding protein [Sediminimonas qiaohouensis]MTJ05236.1 HAMP domain-containing protein [Sediminimonas qiaohouensis]
MMFRWLKRTMPRGLYGRALLILILPVVTLQLVVSVVAIRRYFEDVTEQMTQALSREVQYVTQQIPLDARPEKALAAMAAPARALELELRYLPRGAQPPETDRYWYDVSGAIVLRRLDEQLPSLRAVHLTGDGPARLYVETRAGLLELGVNRRRLSARNSHQLFVNMVFFGALMTLIAYLYLRNQLRPIKRLADAAAAFGKGQHLPYKPTGAIEVRAAGHAFLDMRARIERQIEQRTLMLSGVSHDLRTPLTRLKLGLSMLDDKDREPLERDVADMQRMLDEFLSFARGTATDGAPEDTDPTALIREIVEDAQRAGKPVTLGDMPEGDTTLPMRPVAIRRAIENLIGNAVTYGSKAVVSVTVTPRSLRIRVEDDGPGIPPGEREEALKPFTRLDAARNQNRGSSVGLGLAIASDIARAHGGVLRLRQSTDLGGLCADMVIAR